ncbi:MAG: ABC transporter substrate-binding protein [Dehalococcoidia bacterium]|jgi:branched-chain amino acid transport system substrate-binding protein|nr:ABC transporter substrate-binding protein [Dehalococcoidia bacterium]MDP6782592.1 ABC transporter substrate-binding protein [Dehalococcoidia bacterium]
MRRKHWVVMVLGALLLVASPLLAACGGEEPAVAPQPAAPVEKKVKVGLGLSVTGALASTTKPISYGLWDYLKYVNDVQGGLKYTSPAGVQETVTLDIKWEDMAYDPARAVDTYRRLEAWGAQVMHLTAGSMVLTVLDSITRDQVPVVYYGPIQPNSAAARPVYSIGEFPGYSDEDAVFLDWVKANWTESRPPRVGFLNLETAMARVELPGQVPAYAESIGVEHVGQEWVPYALTDASVELKRLADKDPDFIFFAHVPSGASVILKDAVRMGIRDKIKFGQIFWGFTEATIATAGEASEGLYGMVPAALTTEDLPGVNLARETMLTYRPGDLFNSVYLQGFTLGRFMVEGIKKALETVGYENLTRDAINEALFTTTNLDMGGVVPPITIDREFGILANNYRVAVVKDGKFVIVSDWMPSNNLLKGWVPD